ncbi:MAG: BLUF domain-containing protein [Pseudomonadota bacterium]
MYSSIADPALTQQDIASLVQRARRYNEQESITGLLLFHDGVFLQVLEGDRKKISNLFEKKLMRDQRHSALTLFYDQELAERQFRYWYLAFSDLSKQVTRISSPVRKSLSGKHGLYELTNNTSRALELVQQIHRRVLCREHIRLVEDDSNASLKY